MGPARSQAPGTVSDARPWTGSTVCTEKSRRSHKQVGSIDAKAFEALTDIELGDEKWSAGPPRDPTIVDFDGDDDPLKPVNWPSGRKWAMIAVLAVMTFITPLASSMFAPSVPQVLSEFRSDDHVLGSFIVSVYILGYAAGPLIIAPLSELYGRAPIYHVTNVLFIVTTIACGVSSNMTMLICFRFLEGVAGSAALTMGGGTIADLFVAQERGRAMAIWSMGPLVGPVVGPVAGGFLSQAKGWRWVFVVIAIGASVVTCVFLLTVKETYAPVLLEQKARRLRKTTGNSALRAKTDQGITPAELGKRALVRPMKMLFLSPIVFSLSLFVAVSYGYMYLLFTTITGVFQGQYGFDSGIVGLTYLGTGVGMFAGVSLFGMCSDKFIKRKAAGGEMKPEYRLPPIIPSAILVPVGLFLYGWTVQYHLHWLVPIVGTGLVGLGMMGVFMPINTYLVDSFPMHAASAMAANTVLRSVVGAVLPLAGPAMYSSLGLGWGNSLLAFIALAMVPIPMLFIRYGEYLRTSPRFQLNL